MMGQVLMVIAYVNNFSNETKFTFVIPQHKKSPLNNRENSVKEDRKITQRINECPSLTWYKVILTLILSRPDLKGENVFKNCRVS